MRHRIFWVVIGAPFALIIIGAGAALSLPTTRHLISASLNRPDQMPALSANSQVHYQPGAEDFARDVGHCSQMPSRGLKPCMGGASRIP
jgi:hypothetical protein